MLFKADTAEQGQAQETEAGADIPDSPNMAEIPDIQGIPDIPDKPEAEAENEKTGGRQNSDAVQPER